MWPHRLVFANVFLFAQLLFLADILNRLADDPQLDVEWAGVLGVTIIYMILAGFYLLATYFYIGWLYVQANRLISSPPVAVVNVRNKAGTSQYQQSVTDIKRGPNLKRKAVVFLGDVIIETILYAFALSFLILVIIQLDGIETDPNNIPPRSWAVVFIPLFLFFIILIPLFIVLAIRVASENRYERQLGNGACCSATFGGLLFCCRVDREQLAHAKEVKHDKNAEYMANNAYHQLPCAFLCTPSMTYGWLDLLLGWVWFLSIFAGLITAILIAVRLDGGTNTPSLAVAFIPLWIDEILLVIFGFLLLFALCCCFRRQTDRPVSRNALFSKYLEGVFAIFTGVLLGTQQILLAEQVDLNENENWQIIFIPLFIFCAIVVCLGCCYGGCCGDKKEALPLDDDLSAAVPGLTKEEVDAEATSMWGVFSTIG